MSDTDGIALPADDSLVGPPLLPEVDERRRDKLLRYAKHGARLTGVATHRIVTRTLWWGGWGLVLGLAVFAGEWWLGWLAFPWPAAQPWIVGSLGVALAAAGIGCWGHAGFWRGVGRFVLALGIDKGRVGPSDDKGRVGPSDDKGRVGPSDDKGLVVSLLSAMLDRMTALLRKSRRIDGALEKTELWAGDLPLERWESLLKQSAAGVIGESEGQGNRLMRWIRGFVVRRIEQVMLRIVRKEIEAGHGGGVSMQKVREVALAMAEKQFQKGIVGLMNEQLLLMTGLFALLAALPPVVALGLRWWLT
jgi:hypothetical protein